MGFAQDYISFLNRWRHAVLGGWLFAVLFGAYFAYAFFISTVIKYEAPVNTPGHDAEIEFNRIFPTQNHAGDTIILLSTKDSSPIFVEPSVKNSLRGFTSDLTAALDGYSGRSEVDGAKIAFTLMSYLQIADPPLSASVSATTFLDDPDETKASATIMTVSIPKNSLVQGGEDANNFADWLDDRLKEFGNRHGLLERLKIRATGMIVIGRDCLYGTEHDMVVMDGAAFPVALSILAIMLRSFRLLLIPCCTIIATGVVSFAIMYPVAQNFDVIAVCPSVMMSTAIAFSIDYSLFLLSRWREEIIKRHTIFDACVLMVESAGHTIMVSGATIALCWFGLCVFPVMLLSTVGGGAGLTILLTFFANITIVPAMLLTFRSYFVSFEGFGFTGLCDSPCTGYNEDELAYARICLNEEASDQSHSLENGSQRQHFLNSPDADRDRAISGPLYTGEESSPERSPLTMGVLVTGEARDTTPNSAGKRLRKLRIPSLTSLNEESPSESDGKNGTALRSVSADGFSRKQTTMIESAAGGYTSKRSTGDNTTHPLDDIAKLETSCWYKCGLFFFGTNFAAACSIVLVLGCAAPLAPYAIDFGHSESFELLMPRGYEGTEAFQDLGVLFGGGRIAPYNLLVKSTDTLESRGVLSDLFFNDMIDMIEEDLLTATPRGASEKRLILDDGVSSMMYLKGTRVRFSTAQNEDERSLLQCAAEEFVSVAQDLSIDLQCIDERLPECADEVRAFETTHWKAAACLKNSSNPFPEYPSLPWPDFPWSDLDLNTLCSEDPTNTICLGGCLLLHPLVPFSDTLRKSGRVDRVTHDLMSCIVSNTEIDGPTAIGDEASLPCVSLAERGAQKKSVPYSMWNAPRMEHNSKIQTADSSIAAIVDVLHLLPWALTVQKYGVGSVSEPSHSEVVSLLYSAAFLAASRSHIGNDTAKISEKEDMRADCRSILAQVALQVRFSVSAEYDKNSQTYSYVHIDNAHSWIMVELSVDPYSHDGSNWIEDERALLAERSEVGRQYGQRMYEFWLAGGGVAPHDTVAKVYEFFPMAVGVTVGLVFSMVGIAFRSILVPLRSMQVFSLNCNSSSEFFSCPHEEKQYAPHRIV